MQLASSQWPSCTLWESKAGTFMHLFRVEVNYFIYPLQEFMSNLPDQRESYRTSIRQSEMVFLISPSQNLCIPCSSP